jgi:hypothetical protein
MARRSSRPSIRSTPNEVPVHVEGAIRILTCHRTPAQISFSLGPPVASGALTAREPHFI